MYDRLLHSRPLSKSPKESNKVLTNASPLPKRCKYLKFSATSAVRSSRVRQRTPIGHSSRLMRIRLSLRPAPQRDPFGWLMWGR